MNFKQPVIRRAKKPNKVEPCKNSYLPDYNVRNSKIPVEEIEKSKKELIEPLKKKPIIITDYSSKKKRKKPSVNSRRVFHSQTHESEIQYRKDGSVKIILR